jgi:hypothetical protein
VHASRCLWIALAPYYSLQRPPSPVALNPWDSAFPRRRLIQSYISAARRHGVPTHQVVSWVRRKLGADVVIIRQRSDGTLGCAIPCLFCQRELLRFDLRVHCSLSNGGFFSGRLTDRGAPKPTLTMGQRRMLNKDF